MGQTVRVGAFVLITLSILALFVFLIGSMESRFESNYRLQAQFQNVSGLEEGADVRVGGLRKGAVRKIVLPSQPEGKILVVMDLSKQTESIVKQDSVASIKSEGLVGNKYVDVSFGTAGSASIQNGSTIGSEPPLDISDLIGKTNQILDSTKGAIDNLQAATGNISSITGKIDNGRGTVGALINDKSVYQEASAGVSALRQDADALKHNFFLRGYFNKRGFADPGEIKKYEIAQLPGEAPVKTFNYDGDQMFDKADSAKLKNEKKLNDAGTLIEQENPTLAVIVCSAGPKGDADKDRELSAARAYAVRSYLVDRYKIEDQKLKILAAGKTEEPASVRILVYRVKG